MKLYQKIITILLLLIVFIYVCNISLLPQSLILIQGETLDLNTMLGISVGKTNNTETMEAASNLNQNIINSAGNMQVSLNLFGKLPVKEITVNVLPKTTVIPIGKAIGMKLYTNGVLVVGMSEIEGEKPYENTGIQEGDRIIEINHEKIDNTNELIDTVNKSMGEQLEVKYIRQEETKTASIKPVRTQDEQYKLGLWVRDAAAGVGTMTFYEPSSGMFGSLGHGITDIDTSELIEIANGDLVTTNIISIAKGEKGSPGEIRGTIEGGIKLGDISKNTAFGVYGSVTNTTRIKNGKFTEMEVALRNEIKQGKAEILCELDNGKIDSYEIEIERIYKNNNEDNKSMVIKVTDKRLIEKTRWNCTGNEWSTNYSKWKIYRCSNTRIS